MVNDNYKIKFGKYKHKKLKDIPFDYLRWLVDQEFCPNQVKKYVKEHENFV
jgi:uncharacterized protein (DUF3820 family)